MHPAGGRHQLPADWPALQRPVRLRLVQLQGGQVRKPAHRLHGIPLSIFAICNGNPDEATINKTFETLEKEQNKTLLDMYFSGSPDIKHNATQTEGRLDDGLSTLATEHRGAALKFGTALLLPLPGPAAQATFSAIEVLVMDASQYVLLAMLFLVVSIVVSLTMLKDIAILLGGEPRIFGLSKLV